MAKKRNPERLSASQILELQNNLKKQKRFFNYNSKLDGKNLAPFVIDTEWNKQKRDKMRKSIQEINKILPPSSASSTLTATQPAPSVTAKVDKKKLVRFGSDFFVDAQAFLYGTYDGEFFKMGKLNGGAQSSQPDLFLDYEKVNISDFDISYKKNNIISDSNGNIPYTKLIEREFKNQETNSQSSNPNMEEVDATDANKNKYIKNPDGTYLRLGERKNYTYDPKTRQFNKIESASQSAPSVTAKDVLEQKAIREAAARQLNVQKAPIRNGVNNYMGTQRPVATQSTNSQSIASSTKKNLIKTQDGYLFDSQDRVYQERNGELWRVGRMEGSEIKFMLDEKVNKSDFNISSANYKSQDQTKDGLRKIQDGYLVDSENRVYQERGNELWRVGRMEGSQVKLMLDEKVNRSDLSNAQQAMTLAERRAGSNPNMAKVDATDANKNKYIKNPDGTYLRLGERKNYTYDPKTRQFNRIESASQPTKPTMPEATIAERRAGRNADIETEANGEKLPPVQSDMVKAVQEHLNSFLYEKAIQQKGYTRGADGLVYDETGKKVNTDRISTTAKNERIDEDGKFGPETEAALKIYNLANPQNQIKYNELPSGRKVISTGGLSGTPKSLFKPKEGGKNGELVFTGTLDDIKLNENTPEQIRSYINNGSIPRYQEGKISLDPLKIKQTVLPNPTAPVDKVVSPIKQPTQSTGKVSNTFASKLNPENLQRIGGNLADTLSIANLIRESSQPLPTYQQTPDWIDYTNKIANRANQGLASAVQSEFNRNMNTNRASGYAQVLGAAGGGGTQGAVLGALGQVNQNSADAIGKYALADQAQRDVNLNQYGNVARAEEATNQSMFGMEYQNAINRQSQATSMIPGIMSQIGQRNQTYNSYGPGSVYEKFINAQIQEAESNAELAKSMNSNYGNLFGTSTTPNVKVSNKDNRLISGIRTGVGTGVGTGAGISMLPFSQSILRDSVSSIPIENSNITPSSQSISFDRVKRLIENSNIAPSSLSEDDKNLLKRVGILFSN